ncbi:MAG: AAA family ATPase [Candidatus Odinarchaeia archaeon]
MPNPLFEYASKIANEAVQLDKQNQKKMAAEKYLQAADVLLKLMKTTDNTSLKKICFEHAEQYVTRAKELKNPISSASSPYESQAEITEEDEQISKAISDIVLTEKPNVRWTDVADLEHAKQILREAVVIPMLRPDLFTGARKPWKGILLFGPPGCGKTFISKAVANEINATFFSADAATLVSKWLGESEKTIKTLFKTARANSPSIIFIDEVDAIATTRDDDEVGGERRLKTQLLIEMDGIKDSGPKGPVVLAATNRPWDLDPAFRRRFEKRIYIPLPDFTARIEVFKHHLAGIELDPNIDFKELARLSEGFTSSDISLICRDSSMMPIRELDKEGLLENIDVKIRPLTMDDILKSMKKIKPVVTREEINAYEKWDQEHGSS